MRLSLDFIFAVISDTFDGATLKCSTDESPSFESLGILSEQSAGSADLIYFDLSETVNADGMQEISIVTTESRSGLFEDCSQIVMPDDVDLANVFNVVSEAFSRYSKWFRSIQYVISSGQTLQRLIDLTAEINPNPMFICDATFKMMAYSSGDFAEASSVWKYQLEHSYLPSSVMRNLIENAELDKLSNTRGAWIVDEPTGFGQYPLVSRSIWVDGTHYGNFIIIGFYQKLDVRDLEIANQVGDLLSSAIIGGKINIADNPNYHLSFIEDLLEGTRLDKDAIASQLAIHRWTGIGEFKVILVDTRPDHNSLRKRIISTLSNELSALSLPYDDMILLVVDQSMQPENSLQKILERAVESFGRTIGVSETFDDFSDIRAYYEQSLFCLESERKIGGSPRVVQYADIWPRHLKMLAQDAIQPCAEAMKLAEHDREHGTEYCKTLAEWLMCERNTTKTSEKIYLHRNSLKNRLSAIEDLIDCDLDSPWERARMGISLFILGALDDSLS